MARAVRKYLEVGAGGQNFLDRFENTEGGKAGSVEAASQPKPHTRSTLAAHESILAVRTASTRALNLPRSVEHDIPSSPHSLDACTESSS